MPALTPWRKLAPQGTEWCGQARNAPTRSGAAGVAGGKRTGLGDQSVGRDLVLHGSGTEDRDQKHRSRGDRQIRQDLAPHRRCTCAARLSVPPAAASGQGHRETRNGFRATEWHRSGWFGDPMVRSSEDLRSEREVLAGLSATSGTVPSRSGSYVVRVCRQGRCREATSQPLTKRRCPRHAHSCQPGVLTRRQRPRFDRANRTAKTVCSGSQNAITERIEIGHRGKADDKTAGTADEVERKG